MVVLNLVLRVDRLLLCFAFLWLKGEGFRDGHVVSQNAQDPLGRRFQSVTAV